MRAFVFLSLIATAFGCSTPNSDPNALALVNGHSISGEVFGAYADRVVPPGQPLDEEGKTELLNRLIDDEVMLQEALEQGVYKDPMVRRTLITQLLRQSVYAEAASSNVSEEEARSFFEEHKEDFVVPEKVQVRRILLRPKDGESDEEVQARLAKLLPQIKANPDAFRALARQHSDDHYAQRGGDLGYISKKGKKNLPKEIVDEAFKLDLGQTSRPFSADGGWNIVQVVNRRDRIERSFEQMKASVERRIRTNRQDTLKSEFIAKLRSKADVRINQGQVQSYTWQRSAPSMPGMGGTAVPLQLSPVRRPEAPAGPR